MCRGLDSYRWQKVWDEKEKKWKWNN